MQQIVLAGATAIFSLGRISAAFEKIGFSTKFIDADFMKPFATEDGIEFVSCTGNCLSGERAIFEGSGPLLRQGSAQAGSGTAVGEHRRTTDSPIVVPLTEYWISQVAKNPSWCRISEVALKAARSKKFFYEFMAYNGFFSPKVFENEDEARTFIETSDTSTGSVSEILVKPDSLNSGYGIEVVGKENLGLLSKYVYQAKNLKNHATRIFEIENTGVIFTERIHGTEYSADCFFYKGRISVVRICRKKIELIRDKPCCVEYQVLERGTKSDGADESEFSKCERELKSWCEKIFSSDDISFAQFDFIRSDAKDASTGSTSSPTEGTEEAFYPIDFAPRIGGGLRELFQEYEATRGVNVYAEAVSKMSGVSTGRSKLRRFDGSTRLTNRRLSDLVATSKTLLTQINILPRFSGYITDDNYDLPPGKQIIFKKKGDYVTSNPTSASSRIAIVICEK